MPLTFATLAIGVPAILMAAFPFSDAKRALPNLSSSDLVATAKTLCKLPRGTYIFGYDIAVKTDKGLPIPSGRVCRDVVKGGWISGAGS